jgi:hypothetical protein
MLLNALCEAGVTIDSDGRYPINDAISQRLANYSNDGNGDNGGAFF